MKNYHAQFKKGYYVPKYPEKYLGTNKPLFRSSYELKFFQFCDLSPHVKEWGNETFAIPYIHPKDEKIHKYYIDNFVTFEKEGKKEKYLIEIKPFKQTLPPKYSNRKKEETYAFELLTWQINSKKWESAKQFAEKNDCKFLIITEKELFSEKK